MMVSLNHVAGLRNGSVMGMTKQGTIITSKYYYAPHVKIWWQPIIALIVWANHHY